MNEDSMKVHRDYSDQEIVSAIKNNRGLDKVLDYMYQSYFNILKTIILSNNGNEADAEDTIQEVFIAFIDIVQKDKFRGESAIKSFLYTLTRNMWYTELRRRNSALKRGEFFENEKDSIENDVSEHLTYLEGLSLVTKLFETLGEVCQKILTLFYFENQSMKEILEQVAYENEQVLRNKKYKCQKELISMVENSPELYNNLKSALQHGRP